MTTMIYETARRTVTTRREAKPAAPTARKTPRANIGIVTDDNPLIRADTQARDAMVLIDGLVPRWLAEQFIALAELHNRAIKA